MLHSLCRVLQSMDTSCDQRKTKTVSTSLVIGGGLAGLATSIHVARAGLRVTCVQSDELRSDLVGESLDWSAPDLLKGIGLPTDILMQRGIATIKQHVTLQLLDGSERHYVPGAWLAESPFNVCLDTIHVDREALAQVIRDLAEREGVHLISDQVIRDRSTKPDASFLSRQSKACSCTPGGS